MKISDTRDVTLQRANRFFKDLRKEDQIYIIGTNKYGLAMASFMNRHEYNVKGFINDFTYEIAYAGYPVCKSASINENDIIINCIVEGRIVDVNKHISSLNVKSTCDYLTLQFANQQELLEIDFLEETQNILNNKSTYIEVYNLLSDEQSKMEFEALTNFRLNRDFNYMLDFKFRLNEQYFEDFFRIDELYSFVDGGSFDGATTLEFIKRQPFYKSIYIFEPSLSSYKQIEKKFNESNRIEIYNKGLWDSEKTLFFNSNLGSASKIEASGIDTIETATLDTVIREKVDFIKLDIEGAEMPALRGSEKLIKQYKPILAVCVYHKQDDFINIPRMVMDMNSNYKIYLRHYTQGVYETVMYFI